MRLTDGQIVDGRYRLLSRIGSGGMADVWCASDSELGREVALKVLHDNFARDREFVERFRREASAAAGLQHPNVVGVFDRGAFEDTWYIAMEYVDGSSLRELIDRGLRIDEAVEAARQILAAASFAHGRGIVHRDLKPANVLVDREGRVQVTDFGIARAGGSEITQTGSVMGTAQYLSPEQAQGRDVTAATDQYAVAVMLYEMLTGRVPFAGDSAVAVALKQVSEQPRPPSEINPDVPPALDAVVLRGLSKDPANRYESAAAMSAALDAAEADPHKVDDTARFAAVGPPPEEDGGRRRRRLQIALAGAALAALAALALLLLLGGSPETVAVPGVIGQQEEDASEELRLAGLHVEVGERRADDAEEGVVIDQDPEGGEEVEIGETVTLTVSLGPDAVPVPNVADRRRRRAVQILENAGFDVDPQSQPSVDVAQGRAIGTRPPAGTPRPPGATITLLISSGPELVAVPSVVGMERLDARAVLEAEDFLVRTESEDAEAPEGQVVRQIPDAGTNLPRGETVTIVFSSGRVSVDNVVGRRQAAAERRLSAQGLVPRARERQVDDRSDDGIVLEQTPSAGTRVRRGSSVTLVVGVFEPPPEPEPDQEEPGP